MITLNQMQLLERKIETAISKLLALADENLALKEKAGAAETETRFLREKYGSMENEFDALRDKYASIESEKNALSERCATLEESNRALQARVSEYQMNQSRVEQGILNALHKLDVVENTIIETVGMDTGESPEGAAPETAAFFPQRDDGGAALQGGPFPEDGDTPEDDALEAEEELEEDGFALSGEPEEEDSFLDEEPEGEEFSPEEEGEDLFAQEEENLFSPDGGQIDEPEFSAESEESGESGNPSGGTRDFSPGPDFF